MLDFIKSLFFKFHDIMLYPGKYINEQFGYILAGVIFFFVALAAISICYVLLRWLYWHVVFSTVYIVVMLYHQYKMPDIEIINTDYRKQYLLTWHIRYIASIFFSGRTLDWVGVSSVDLQFIDLKFRFPAGFWPVIERGPQLQAYIANGWKKVDTNSIESN